MDFDRGEDAGASSAWAGFASTVSGVLATVSWGCCGFVGPLAWFGALVFTAFALGFGWLALRRLRRGTDGYVFGLVGLILGIGNAIPLLIGLALQVSVALTILSVWILAKS